MEQWTSTKSMKLQNWKLKKKNYFDYNVNEINSHINCKNLDVQFDVKNKDGSKIYNLYGEGEECRERREGKELSCS